MESQSDHVISAELRSYSQHSRQNQPDKVLVQAGKLFVNFINILVSRYYYEEASEIKFGDVEIQYNVIICKLASKGHE